MSQSHFLKTVLEHDQNYCNHVQQSCVLLPLKQLLYRQRLGCVITCCQLLSSGCLCCVETAIKQQYDGGSLLSVCDNTAINCDELVKIANLLPSVYPEIHINYLHAEFNQNLIDLKQKFRNSSTNSNVVGAG